MLEDYFRQFTGRLLQTPPPYSAKRVGGVRAYELARQHKPVNLTPVEVEIYALELLSLQGEQVQFAVECSGGTYVRSLAHDLGQKLGCGAHLAGLRRTAVAEFTENRAVTLERLQEAAQQGNLESCVVRLEALLPDCPELVVRGREETSVRHGHAFELAQALRPGTGRGPWTCARRESPQNSRPGTPPDCRGPSRFRRYLSSQPGGRVASSLFYQVAAQRARCPILLTRYSRSCRFPAGLRIPPTAQRPAAL